MKVLSGRANEFPQCGIEGDFGSPAGLTVVEVAARDVGVHGFFDAESLGAELDFVCAVSFGFAPFVFHREDRAIFVKFHDVADPVEMERGRADRKPAGGADAGAGFVGAFVCALVQDAPLGGELVFFPLLVEVDEGALPRAKEDVLECR